MSNPKKVTGTEYVLFTQAAPGAPWKNAIEPYMLPGASVPQITIGADGLATPVPADTASLAVSPARIGQLTAASLDGTGTLGDPGNLADRLDAKFWQSKVPAASITDQHATAGGQVFGLATAGGGALLFYTDTAELTLTPPQGETLHLSIPGFYSGVRHLRPAARRDGAASGRRLLRHHGGSLTTSSRTDPADSASGKEVCRVSDVRPCPLRMALPAC